MIREIKYVFTKSVNNYTCHSLFATITNNYLSRLKLNSYSKQPEYKVSFSDREITILINEDDIKVENLLKEINLTSENENLKGYLISDKIIEIENKFLNGDFVIARGVISYARKSNENGKVKNICPINPMGNFVEGQRKHTLEYLSKKLGLELLEDTREFRFEMISYKHFNLKNNVYSKSNGGIVSLHNVFYFEVMGYVNNSDTVNSLRYTSLGKKRDYGLGNVYISNYEKAL